MKITLDCFMLQLYAHLIEWEVPSPTACLVKKWLTQKMSADGIYTCLSQIPNDVRLSIETAIENLNFKRLYPFREIAYRFRVLVCNPDSVWEYGDDSFWEINAPHFSEEQERKVLDALNSFVRDITRQGR